jgi:hypothetical protein
MRGKVFARGGENSPLSVLGRGPRARVLGAAQRDAWVARTAQQPYTRTVLCSTVSAILRRVVVRSKPAGRAADQDHPDPGGAACIALSNTRHGVETHTAAAWVRERAAA